MVIEALYNLYKEYNRAFTYLVAANREWETDYSLCMLDGIPVNHCVQIDMRGLHRTDLEKLAGMPEIAVRGILRKKIFEIENSIAMYQLLEKLFSRNGKDSLFKTRFRAILNNLRQKFGKPIGLLALTKEKYDAMLSSEFGKLHGEQITDWEVKDLSGFDTFFGPQQFRNHLIVNNGQCKYLLYIRSSDPVYKLKKPDLVVNHTLLSDSNMRREIKANALTLNVDAPEMEYAKRINDTKDYMVEMAMAFPVTSIEDLYSDRFKTYLIAQGIDPKDVASGKAAIRCKPAKGTYGCYGHISGSLINRDFRRELKKNLNLRGNYIAQPEMTTSVVINTDSRDTENKEYAFIDRIFLGMIDGHPRFIGGIRNLISTKTVEARKHRIHGNHSAIWAEIKSTY